MLQFGLGLTLLLVYLEYSRIIENRHNKVYLRLIQSHNDFKAQIREIYRPEIVVIDITPPDSELDNDPPHLL